MIVTSYSKDDDNVVVHSFNFLNRVIAVYSELVSTTGVLTFALKSENTKPSDLLLRK